jgi:hypothetical protein
MNTLSSLLVIPAKAGIQRLGSTARNWIPAFAGMAALFGAAQ